MRKVKHWTPEDVDTAVNLRSKGHTYASIAIQLGHPQPAVQSVVARVREMRRKAKELGAE